MTDEDRVRDLLAQAFDVTPPHGATAARVRQAHRRRRLTASATAVVGVAVVAVAAVTLPGLGERSTGLPAAVRSATPTASSTKASSLPAILVDGDVVGATGRVASVPGQPVRFCAPVAVADVGYAPGKEPPPAGCALGLDVVGVNLATLTGRREKQGAVEGWAYLRGVYRAGTLSVTVQSKALSSPADFDADWVTPPCPKPAGGWLTMGRGQNPTALQTKLDAFMAAHKNEVTSSAIFRPTDTQVVMVVVADHPDLVHASLGANSSALCVVKSGFTSAQVAAAESAVMSLAGGSSSDNGIYESGPRTLSDGQPAIGLSAVMVTPALRALAAAFPPGLIRVQPWLMQVAPGAPLPSPLPTPASDASPFTTGPPSS